MAGPPSARWRPGGTESRPRLLDRVPLDDALLNVVVAVRVLAAELQHRRAVHPHLPGHRRIGGGGIAHTLHRLELVTVVLEPDAALGHREIVNGRKGCRTPGRGGPPPPAAGTG